MPSNDLTPEELLANAQHASDELRQARDHMRKEKTAEAAITYCKAFQAARTAREAIPKPRLVTP